MCIQCIHCYAFDAEVLWTSLHKLHRLTEQFNVYMNSQYVARYWYLFVCIKRSIPAKCKIVVV